MPNFIRTDVTAVKFYKNQVLAGIGSSLNNFNRTAKKILDKKIVLKGNKVHGIEPRTQTDQILVYGGKQFAVVTIDNYQIILCNKIACCNDWIHTAVWQDNGTIALFTAHNVVQIWDPVNYKLLSTHNSKNNSILYSGLLKPLNDELLVFAGTVYSEVIIQYATCGDAKPLHELTGHKGVIFSISCDFDKKNIVTTSDDRSVRIWRIKNNDDSEINTRKYWISAEISCIYELYGHSARVMKNCIADKFVISVGEDGAVCFWDYNGTLLYTNTTHQGSIWCIDVDDNYLVTGAGDSALALHPLSMVTYFGTKEIINVSGNPKKVLLTARQNAVILNNNNELIYCDIQNKNNVILKLNQESSNKFLEHSPCKQIIAVADMLGNLDIFIENCKGESTLTHILQEKLDRFNIKKVLSMHWADNRHLIFCSDHGDLFVISKNNGEVELCANFILPNSKERWLTSAAMNEDGVLVVGDRCGNVHIYEKNGLHSNLQNPFKTFKKIHGRYGPTSITPSQKYFFTTGRDGTIKHFQLKPCPKYLSSKKLDYEWVEMFLDKEKNIICGFQERIFVVYNLENNQKLLQVNCGGGHRSWDAIRHFVKVKDKYCETVTLLYIKNSEIHLHSYELNQIVSDLLINVSHSKEINCLKFITNDKSKSDDGIGSLYYIAGGEDTLLSSTTCHDNVFRDQIIFKHLSSIKSLKILHLGEDKVLVISAGGRAQLCANILHISKSHKDMQVEEITNYLVNGTDRQRKGNKNWKEIEIDFNPETRIMDIDLIREDSNAVTIFAGCSDANLRIFNLSLESNEFQPITSIKYHKTCILKTLCIKMLNHNILITCTTRGEVTFWNVSELKPFLTVKANKSGIDCLDAKVISTGRLLVGTGGDDNAVHLLFLEIVNKEDVTSLRVINHWNCDKYHCSQITGFKFVDNYFVTASIDQRVSLVEWCIKEERLECSFLNQIYSDVPDIQGMEVSSYSQELITVSVFGKGVETFTISTRRDSKTSS